MNSCVIWLNNKNLFHFCEYPSGAFLASCAFHIQHTSQTKKSDAGFAICQPLFSSRWDRYVYSATLLEPAHHRTSPSQSQPMAHHRATHMLSERPSTIPTRLATSARSTKTNVASYDWVCSPATQPKPRLGMEVSAGQFQVTWAGRDGCVLPMMHYLMMLAMYCQWCTAWWCWLDDAGYVLPMMHYLMMLTWWCWLCTACTTWWCWLDDAGYVLPVMHYLMMLTWWCWQCTANDALLDDVDLMMLAMYCQWCTTWWCWLCTANDALLDAGYVLPMMHYLMMLAMYCQWCTTWWCWLCTANDALLDDANENISCSTFTAIY